MRRGLWFVFGGLGITATVSVVGLYLLARTYWDFPDAEAELPAALNAYQRDGLPFVAADLHLSRPGHDNAAPIVRAAIALMPKRVSEDTLLKAIRAGDADSVVRRFQPALDTLETAAAIKQANFGRDWDLGPKIEFSEYRPMRTLAKVLAARAEGAARRGDDPAALRDLSLIRRLGTWVGDEPTILSMLVRVSIELTAINGEERSLAAAQISPDRVARFRTWLGQAEPLPRWGDALRGEAFIGIATYRNFAAFGGRKAFDDSYGEPKIDVRTLRRSGLPEGRTECGFMARHLQIWDEAYRETDGFRTPILEAVERFKSVENRWENKRGWSASLAPMVLSTLEGTGNSIVQLQARQRTAAAMLDALEARSRTGSWPTTVAGMDPFSEKPLRLKREGARIRIYSVGRNRRDEGGKGIRDVKGPGPKPDDVASVFPPLPQ